MQRGLCAWGGNIIRIWEVFSDKDRVKHNNESSVAG